MTMIPIVVGALGTVPKGLEKRQKELKIGGRIETIQTSVLENETPKMISDYEI